MQVRWQVLMIFSATLLFSCLHAKEPEPVERPKPVSIQQVLREQWDFIGKKIVVYGFLSKNCSSLCLFAYQDDANNWNVPNSITIFGDYEMLAEIRSRCGDGYVFVTANIGVIEGFPRPGLIDITDIRKTSQQEYSDFICWPND